MRKGTIGGAATALLLLGFSLGCSPGAQVSAPQLPPDVVAVINGEAVTLAQFEDQYARSVGGPEVAAKDSLGAYQDFLSRYVDFRLKVLAAKAAGYADDPSIAQEMAGYRSQLARPYLLEQEVIEPLVQDVYDKQQEMVDASHILIRVDEDAPPADTLKAYEKMQSLVDSLAQGAAFGELAKAYSEDPSARREGLGYEGRLGFFTGGRMVKSFEDQAFATPVGGVSPIFRSRFGYHIMFVHDRQPRPRDIRIAHLMIRPAGFTREDTLAAIARIDSIKTRIEAGERFADLARQYSEDPASKPKGGDLGVVQYDGQLLPSLKTAAFSLENEGDVSDRVTTQYGFHLIELTERAPAPTFEDAYDDLKALVSRMPRAQAAEDRFAAAVVDAREVSIDQEVLDAAFRMVGPDSLVTRLAFRRFPDDLWPQSFATLSDSTYTLGQLAKFTETLIGPRTAPPMMNVQQLVDAFLKDKAIDYEVHALEERDADFKRTMEEFHNGLLLFKLMEDSIWTAAAQDSAALLQHYTANQDQYRFPDRVRIITLFSTSDSLLRVAGERFDAGLSPGDLMEEFAADSLQMLRIDTTYVAGTTNSVFDQALALNDGQRTGPLTYNRGHILLIRDGQDPARLKTFKEARAEVVNDYQAILEEALLKRLRQQYAVETYPARLVQAFAQARAATGTTTGNSTR